MHRNYRQGEDEFIFNRCQQVDFAEFINFNRLIRFRECFRLIVVRDRAETIRCVDKMTKRLAATLTCERYRNRRIAFQHGETLVIDSERHGAFDIAVHTDHRFGDTLYLFRSIDTLVIEAFLSRTNRIKSQG
ncbi:hypothetical protein AFK65_07700 [Cronobacter universalis NCTC 9529]|uniref:Uncharacterized protein n=1 Tax=Cronobacter universalis NCTC 9529 TaxID=1074000 RepID=A0AAC8VPC9_9ENTR|nr:hypothetical protein AFK65_07700 [Cronobacter universalis NCTC 9529]